MMVIDRLNAFEMYILLTLKTLQFLGITHYAYLQVCFKLYQHRHDSRVRLRC